MIPLNNNNHPSIMQAANAISPFSLYQQPFQGLPVAVYAAVTAVQFQVRSPQPEWQPRVAAAAGACRNHFKYCRIAIHTNNPSSD